MTTLDFRYSKDGGRNWSAWRQLDMGEVGDFCKTIPTTRLGQARQWIFDIRVTDPVRADLISMSVQLESSS